MKMYKIAYWVSTILLTLMLLTLGAMFVVNNDTVVPAFGRLGYPAHTTYVVAVANVLGVAVIWFNFSTTLKEWAYAGFFFIFALALIAHIDVRQFSPVVILLIIALALLAASYISNARIQKV